MPEPNSQASLIADFRAIGIAPGSVLMVHSALGKVGCTLGGPVTVIQALLDVLGADGTLVMSAETPQMADPAEWNDPRVDPAWHETIRGHMPVFDPATTPTSMGAIPEAFSTFPGTMRSFHPLVSVCANGRHARMITKDHALEFCEGRGTPFEKLYELDGFTLLLGVGFNRCTSLHYAESLTPGRRKSTSRYVLEQGGETIWVENPDMAADNGEHFPVVGDMFLAAGRVKRARIGNAEALLFSTRDLVDFAEAYFRRSLR